MYLDLYSIISEYTNCYTKKKYKPGKVTTGEQIAYRWPTPPLAN